MDLCISLTTTEAKETSTSSIETPELRYHNHDSASSSNIKKSFAILNAKVYTHFDNDANQEVHENAIGFVVHENQIQNVFYKEFDYDLAQLRNEGYDIIDMKNKTIIPGLIDAHGHLILLGYKMLQVNLNGNTSVSQIQSSIEDYILENKLSPGSWVIGQGWDHTKWSQQFPTKHDLDQSPILKQYKIILYRVDYHGLWVNQKVIDEWGDVPTEWKGRKEILVDENTGELTGIFLDDSMPLIEKIIPPYSREQSLKAVNLASKRLVAHGIVGMHDAGVYPEQFELIKEGYAKNLIQIRNYAMVTCKDPTQVCVDSLEQVPSTHEKLIIRSVKLFLDGALGSRGAYMLKPYEGFTNDTGFLRIPKDSLNKVAVEKMRVRSILIENQRSYFPNEIYCYVCESCQNALNIIVDVEGNIKFPFALEGFQVNIHAIGDGANRVALEAFQHAKESGLDLKKFRVRIEHAQIIDPSDIPLFASLPVIPSMQPTHATSDMDFFEDLLGKERARDSAYIWKTLLNKGVKHLPFSSDFPVENVNPFEGIYAAITRCDKTGNSPQGTEGWYPKEKVSRYQAIKGFTSDAAYASFMENVTGKIQSKNWADFVVLDRDIMAAENPMDILKTKVLATVIGGEVVFGEL